MKCVYMWFGFIFILLCKLLLNTIQLSSFFFLLSFHLLNLCFYRVLAKLCRVGRLNMDMMNDDMQVTKETRVIVKIFWSVS